MKLFCSLLCLACSVVISLGSSVSHSPELDHMTVMSASGEELQSAMGEELESDGASGLLTDSSLLRVSPGGWTEEPRTRGGRRRQGGRKRNRGQVTVGQKSHTSGQVQLTFSTPDPCLTSHSDYCIHGHCTYLQDLREPVCVCMKGYDGVRCGIQLLQTSSDSGSDGLDDHTHTHTLQLALVIIAVVLSIISCSAIIIIISVQYKAQHNFQAAFLSSSSEREKLQKNPSV
ncbi:uncharacterized protein areg [Salminus brasiliensis]|uniref:uncharacterized protein areg n=1 Tax=Salminus brasiliensis TaxID=930266 RepID=UPI003B8304DA